MPDDAPKGAHDADANRDLLDGALNGAVTPEPLSSGSAGQPL
jgi:hypothetical protein